MSKDCKKSCRDEVGAPEVVGANKEVSVKHPKGNKGCSSMKVTWPTAQRKCLYMSACSMGNKQEELETTVLLESYNLIACTETWWDNPMTGVWLLMATGCSEGTGGQRELEALQSTLRNLYSVKSCPRRIVTSRLKVYE